MTVGRTVRGSRLLRNVVQRQMRAGRTGAKHRREVTVLLLGAVALFVICAMALGYLNARAPISWGIGEEVGTGRRLVIDSRVVMSARLAVVSVTPAGAAAGLKPGQVLDITEWTLRERFAFVYPSSQTELQITGRHGQKQVLLQAPATDVDVSRTADVALRLLLLCSGLLIVQYGHGRAAFAAGIYLAMAAMADSPIMTFAGLPIWVQTGGLTVASAARLVAYGARFVFAMELLCPRSRLMTVAMWSVFAALLGVDFFLVAGRVGSLLAGTPLIPYSSLALPVMQSVTQACSLAVFAAAALLADRTQRFVARIIFLANSVTIVSYIIQQCLLITGGTPPWWMFWYFNSALLGVGIGYPWAIFARRVAGVDFIVSRGVAYAISIGIIVSAVNLLESLIEQVASGVVAGFMLAYGLPVALGLSLNWVQGRVTAGLEALLDHDILNTSQTAQGLKAEFLQANDVAELAAQIAKLSLPLRAEHVTLYGEHGMSLRAITGAGDPPGPATIEPHDQGLQRMLTTSALVELDETGSILRKGLLFPLVVYGRIVGAMHCGPRVHDRGYDRAERMILEDLARDLAVAFVCLDPKLDVRTLLLAGDRNANTNIAAGGAGPELQTNG